MMSLLVYVATGLLLVWAASRKREAIMIVLMVAFLIGTILAQFYHGETLRPMLMACDAFVVLAMLGLWVKHHSQRARIVGTIGLVQVFTALVYANVPYTNWSTWAAAENAAFLMQIIVAGGFADGIATWLVDRFRSLRSGSAFLRRNVGGG